MVFLIKKMISENVFSPKGEKDMRVVNIGSLNIDKTYTVRQFVQPKETIKAIGYAEFCGGKGLNQSVALAKAGAEVWHAGAVGGDGEMLIKMLREAGVHTELIEQKPGPSGHAVIQVNADGQNNIIIYGGANDSISAEYIVSVLAQFGEGDLLLLQNEVSNIDFAMEEAKKRGMQVAFNPSPLNEKIGACRLELVDYFLLNEVEGKAMAGTESEEPDVILRALHMRFPNAAFVLTLGENGAYFAGGGEEIYQKIYPVETVDTTGAGDTFCGYFIAGLAKKLDYPAILKRASAASALAVSRRGAAPSVPAAKEVSDFIRERS